MDDQTLATLGAAAKRGHVGALIELGSRLATGVGAPLAPDDGRALLRHAADGGSALAARHLAVLAGAELDWPGAVEWMTRAADGGDQDARRELDLLTNDLKPWLEPAAEQRLSDTPSIVALPGIAPRWLCEQLIAAGQDSLSAAGVTDRRTGMFMHDAARTNRFAQVKLFDCGLALLLLRARMAAAVGQPVSHCEIMNLLSYDPGEAFELHHDYLDPAEPGFADVLARDGQRVATVLVYLSDDYVGGETNFPQAGVRYRGQIGDGLTFRNVGPDGRIDPATLHAGLPPTRGRKWVLSQWVRDRPQRPI